MIVYLIKSTLCLTVLLAVYFCILEKEKTYKFNRFYLLLGLIFSLLVPLIPISVYQEPEVLSLIPSQNETIIDQNAVSTSLVSVSKHQKGYLTPIILSIYGIVVTYLLYRFIKNISIILLAAHRNKAVVYKGAKLILIQEAVISHTFLHYIFINEKAYKTKSIEKELLSHELTHVRQKHSIDILFIELLNIIFWFNPILIPYKKAIQLNHEFLADQEVLSIYNNVKEYQSLLLSKIGLISPIPLTNSFNYLITKKRLIMMTKKSNRTRVTCKQFFLLPLFATLVFLFSTKVTANAELTHSQTTGENPKRMRETRLKPILNVPDTVKQISFVEVTPAFPGGNEKFIHFLTSKIDPNVASGTVETTFYVNKDGSVTTAIIGNSSGKANESAVLKAIAESPKWNPAIQNGLPLKIGYILTTTFETTNQVKKVIVDGVAIIKEEMVVSFEENQKGEETLIKGKVVDKAGNSISHASISSADYKYRAISDLEGHFSISLPKEQSLIVSCIGYTTRHVQL